MSGHGRAKSAGFAISSFALAIVVSCVPSTQRQAVDDAEGNQLAFERKVAAEPVMIKPWDDYMECGIQKRLLRACDMRYWPGQAYPDQPIPGEKTPGIVWSCEDQQHTDKRLPPTKVCYADASPERKRAYPCAMVPVGSQQSGDKFCKASPVAIKRDA